MKHCFFPRAAAFAAVTLVLAALAVPAAAAPASGWSIDIAWGATPLFQRLHSVWTGFFGVEDGAGDAGELANVHGANRSTAEPDGAEIASSLPSDGETTTSLAPSDGAI